MRHDFETRDLAVRQHPCPSEEHCGGWIGSSTKMELGVPRCSIHLSIYRHGFGNAQDFLTVCVIEPRIKLEPLIIKDRLSWQNTDLSWSFYWV